MAKSNASATQSRLSRPATTKSRYTASRSRPATSKSRPPTRATSTAYGYMGNEILCTVSESRGLTPSVGLAFINLTTCEAVLCQFTDTQTYARTCHKLKVFAPSEIVYATTATDSKMIAIIHENIQTEDQATNFREIDRRYWSETAGREDLRRLAFHGELEALQVAVNGNYFAICSFAAVRILHRLCYIY